MSEITPFRIAIADSAIADLHQRIDNTRWPDQLNDEGWSYGAELGYLKSLVDYWRNGFDWREQEAQLNGFDQFTTEFDELSTHFIHQRSPHPQATPLLINHGWPGSIVEFMELIPRLVEPEKFGGNVEDAFHVIAPSLPGYGFSEAAKTSGMNTRAIARRHIALMAKLGYERYICQGGDWGAMVTRHVAELDPEHCRAIHLNMVLALPADAEDPLKGVSAEEQALLADDSQFRKDEMAYFKLQATKPQTVGYALQDSAVGLCAWLTEKFRTWTDCDGEIRNAVSWDTLLTNISLYWYSNSITSSARLYREHMQYPEPQNRIEVPTGAALYKRELVRPPKAWVEASYNLIHWYKADKGGHFAAMEQPQAFAEDLWRFKQAVG
jgi:pimeloyl-ACP methyl ester carboxylesterase